MSVLSFMTRLMTIKSKFTFSNNCYKELLKLFNDALPVNHNVLRDMYRLKKLLSDLIMNYKKIDIYQDNYILF
jgi:hypothetical protein